MQVTNAVQQDSMQHELLDTREALQGVCKIVKEIAVGAKQCDDYNVQLRNAVRSGLVRYTEQSSKIYLLGNGYSKAYTLQSEGYEDLLVADSSAVRLGIGSVNVGCATLEGYKAWRALLRN